VGRLLALSFLRLCFCLEELCLRERNLLSESYTYTWRILAHSKREMTYFCFQIFLLPVLPNLVQRELIYFIIHINCEDGGDCIYGVWIISSSRGFLNWHDKFKVDNIFAAPTWITIYHLHFPAKLRFWSTASLPFAKSIASTGIESWNSPSFSVFVPHCSSSLFNVVVQLCILPNVYAM